jgi:hypothetical protein
MLSLRNFEKSPAIYSISVDSRSRPPGEPVNRYHIDLNSNLQRVRTVQLGSIYIPAQSIQAIGDTLNNNIAFIEPIEFAAPATLVIQETLTVIENSNQMVTTFPPVTVTFPPTLNPIMSVANAMGVPNLVTTDMNHGLYAGTLEWANAGLNISLVGGLYPAPATTSATAFGPQVNPSTIGVSDTDTNMFTFNTGYLASLAADPQNTRNTQPLYTSYIYAQPPTLSELLMMLNNWLSIINNPGNLAPTGKTLILPITFTLNDATNSLCVQAGTYEQIVGAQRRIVTTTILNSGTINFVLGITGNLALSAVPRCFCLNLLPNFMSVPLEHGTFLQSELEAMVSQRLSPLDFTGLVAADRTLHWLDSASVDQALVIPQGRYTGTQLATVLTALMQAAATPNYLMTYSATTGKFTFTNTVNSIMGLNFLLGSPSLAPVLGFQNLSYSGSPVYTSPFSIGSTFPVTTFNLSGNPFTQRFTLAANNVPTVYSNDIVPPMGPNPLRWNTLTSGGTAIVPGGFYSKQVLQVTIGGPGPFSATLVEGSVWTVVVDTPWPGTTGANPYVTLLPSASILAAGGLGQPTANINYYLTPMHRFVTEFIFSNPQAAAELLGFTKQTLPVNTSLNQVLNADEPNVYYLTGGGGLFGLGAASSFTGPFVYNLIGPDYILMRVLNNCDANTSNEHSYLSNSWNILAKMYLRPNYQHISEEMLHVSFSGLKRITSLYVEFINPDGTLVDFNGRDHSYSLLFTMEVKFASTICM